MSAAEPPDPDDPIDDYIENLRHSGLGKNTVDDYEQVLNNHLRTFLEKNDMDAGEMTRDECQELIDEMVNNPEINGNTPEKYAGVIRGFYSHFSSRGTFEVNPMKLAMENYEFPDSPEKYTRDISIPEMREFINQLNHPLILTIVMLLVKTGIRAGELCNIDMRDVHINDPRVEHLFPPLRSEIKDRPDTIYIERHTDMQAGKATNGEIRISSNKRKRSTIIPIDDELKSVLILWLAIRPESKDAGKPFVNRLTGHVGTEIGDRIDNNQVHLLVTKATDDWGWWDSNNTKGMNVTPHYFRHFFTTYMRDRTGDDVFVQFIRGDKGDEALDEYTHNWGDKVKTTYMKHIYNFLR